MLFLYTENYFQFFAIYFRTCNVNKLLIKDQDVDDTAKYENGLIKEYSKKLNKELGKSYLLIILKYLRMFYLLIEKGPTLSDQLL